MASLLDPASLQDDINSARSLLHRGEAARARHELRALLSRLKVVGVERSELVAGQVRVLLALASAEFELTGDLDAAHALLDRAEQLAQDRAPELMASLRGQRALLHLRRGDVAAALRTFDSALLVADAAPVYDRLTLLLNRGALHLERGEVEAARVDFEGSAELATLEGDADSEWKARHNLGYAEFMAGRLPRALAILDRAEQVNPGEPHPIALLDRARVLREAGLAADADALLQQAADRFRDAGVRQDLAETELARAECAIVQGDLVRARRLAVSARRRFQRRGNVRWQRRAELLELRCQRLLADDCGPRARRTALLAAADRADALAAACRRERRRDLARDAALLGEECRLLAGDPPRGSLPVVRATDTLPTRLHAREVRALGALCRGDLTRAGREVRRGLGELGEYQHSFGSLDLRTASAVHGAALSRLGLDVAARTGSPARVLHLVEQSRAVSTRLPQVRPPSDERTAELLTALRRTEEEARSLEGDPSADERLAELAALGQRLQRDIRARAWEVEGERGSATEAPRCVRVRDAARAADVSFVSFAQHRGEWLAVRVGGSRVELQPLAPVAAVSALVRRVRADLDALALPHLPAPLQAAVRRSLDGDLARLDALLLAPLRLDDRAAVLSCSGDLVVLPWGLLPSRLGLSTVVTPSASFWLAGQDGPGRPRAPRAVAVAGPALGHATAEAEQVAATWSGGRALTGGAATTTATHEALVGADLVHVAAHGRHRHDNPLFSSVRLADGDLYAYEIDPAQGSGVAGCVVLSACEAGLATVRPGDESLGLSHVLLQLGTRSVIAGVARVRDDVSARLMRRAHHAMAGGTDAASAVGEAQRELLQSEAPAPFVCFGATW